VSVEAPLLEADGIVKRYGSVTALSGASLCVERGKVTCLLGDNGAGKSTLIKILAGAVQPDEGTLRLDGEPVAFSSPKEALDRGIGTVYQDLAVVPVMPVYRNFFLGREPRKRRGLRGRFDAGVAKATTARELANMGIDLDDVTRPIGTLSGGERQCVAIARAVHFGARVLILDEPTSALGVREAELVLRHIVRARNEGIGVIFITHNVQHAYPVGDRFTILKRGAVSETVRKADIDVTELLIHMAGGTEFERLSDLLKEEQGNGFVANGAPHALQHE
jgi:simple sugar transport system ATP-binding protein